MLEEFTCVDNTSAATVVAMFQPESIEEGLLRFTLWQGAGENDNKAYCLRTFVNESAAMNAEIAFVASLDVGAFDYLLPSVITNISWRLYGTHAAILSLRAGYDAALGGADWLKMTNKGVGVGARLFFSTTPSYSKIDTLALPSVGQNDKVVVEEVFTLFTAHAAVAFAAVISDAAHAAFGTVGAPEEWIVGVDSNMVVCWRSFSTLEAMLASATAAAPTFGGFKAMFPSWTGVDVYNFIPNDFEAGMEAIEMVGLAAAQTAVGIANTHSYYKETVEDPVSGIQPALKV